MIKAHNCTGHAHFPNDTICIHWVPTRPSIVLFLDVECLKSKLGKLVMKFVKVAKPDFYAGKKPTLEIKLTSA